MADYLLILLGVTLSLYLVALSRLTASLGSSRGLFLDAFGAILPFLLFLPLGIILMWPLFFTLGKLSGRTQKMALGEWLWGFAWLVSLVMALWIFWMASGSAPESLTTDGFRETLITGYALYLLAMSAVAFLVWLVSLFTSALHPWTHTFALALLFWPVIPLLLLWGMKWRVVFAALPF